MPGRDVRDEIEEPRASSRCDDHFPDEQAQVDPVPDAGGFSLVVHEGGSVEELVACAQGLHVTALYALVEGEYVSYILGAPQFVNEDFAGLFADSVPPLTPFVVKSEGPPAAN